MPPIGCGARAPPGPILSPMPDKRPEPSSLTGYAINALDRLSARRDDPAFVAELMAGPGNADGS